MNEETQPIIHLATHLDQSNRGAEKDPTPPSSKVLCYCFDYTDEDIALDIAINHHSTILPAITDEIQAGNCACDVKNPSGKCCLNEVKSAIQVCQRQPGESA
jgi:hypothetical protein